MRARIVLGAALIAAALAQAPTGAQGTGAQAQGAGAQGAAAPRAGGGGGAAAGAAAGAPRGPAAVGVMPITVQDVPYVATVPGRAAAFQQVDIRPQVSGEVTAILYEPGRDVAPGTPLFRLDDTPYRADLAAAEAARLGAEASLAAAKATVERYRRLEGSGVSTVERTNAEVALSQSAAALRAAEASLAQAQRALDHATVRSPIEGVADLPAVSVGDLVTANQAAGLTRVTRIDPIYVDVAESSARILRNRASIDAGSLSPGDRLGLRLTLETGAAYAAEGQMVSPGIHVSATTGTVPIRIRFPNPDRLILPGQFLRVEVTLGSVRAMLVPQRATRRSADGALTAFVADDGKARQVVLTEVGTHRNAWMVTAGVAPGEALILDGLRNLRDGAEVAPVPVTIDADGVVRDAPAPQSDPAPQPDPAPVPAPTPLPTSPPAEVAAPPAAAQTSPPGAPPPATQVAPGQSAPVAPVTTDPPAAAAPSAPSAPVPAGQAAAGQGDPGPATAGKDRVGQTPAGPAPAGPASAGQDPFGQGRAGPAAAGPAPAGQVSAGQAPATPAPAGPDPSGQTPAPSAPAPGG